MKEFFDFASNNPVLTWVLFWIVGATIVDTAEKLASCRCNNCCKKDENVDNVDGK